MSDEPSIEDHHARWTADDGPLTDLTQDVWRLHARRQMFHELIEMLEGQGNPHRGYVDEFLAGLYFDAQLVALRRMIDGTKRSVSFRRLINELKDPVIRKMFTREWYVGLWMGDADSESDDRVERHRAEMLRESAGKEFDKWVDQKPGKEDLLGGTPLQDLLDDLVREVEEVENYVNEHVVHRQAEPSEVTLTYGQVDRAIDQAGVTVQALALFLKQQSIMNLVPTVQGDWKAPFRFPLIDRNDDPIPWVDPRGRDDDL